MNMSVTAHHHRLEANSLLCCFRCTDFSMVTAIVQCHLEHMSSGPQFINLMKLVSMFH